MYQRPAAFPSWETEASGYACGSPEFPSAVKGLGTAVPPRSGCSSPTSSLHTPSAHPPSSSRETKVPLLLLNLCATPEIREPLLQTTRGREACTSQRSPDPGLSAPCTQAGGAPGLPASQAPARQRPRAHRPGPATLASSPGLSAVARPSWAEKETLRRSHSPWQVRQQKKPKVTQSRGHIRGHPTGQPSVGLLTSPQT